MVSVNIRAQLPKRTMKDTPRCALCFGPYDVSSDIPQSYYAAQILTVGSLGLAKLSLIFTVVSFRPHRDILIWCYVLEVVVALWTIASSFAVAFQCDLPRPWDSTMGTCVDQTALYPAVGAFNVATDIGIVMLPAVIMPRIQISNKNRLVVQVLFAFRLLYVLDANSLDDLTDDLTGFRYRQF